MNKPIPLKYVATFRFPVAEPFLFRYTFWKPSHFPTGLETHSETAHWRTFRFEQAICGVRAEMRGKSVIADVFSNSRWNKDVAKRLRFRLNQGYGFDEDITPFLRCATKIRAMRPIIERLVGMRISCPESLFEIAMIGLLLQNTTIQRTTSMFSWTLDHFGQKARFDNQTLKAFYAPNNILDVGESILRNEGRFGYRSKYVPEFAAFFSERDDEALRLTPRHALLAELRKIKGVGSYTSTIIAGAALRDTAATALDVWNRKIIARHLFAEEDIEPEKLRNSLFKLFGNQAGMAVLYLTEYEFLSNQNK
jgi:3-methyladenine DNA glycosylase/8-oxoguanine DNA glycosylase